MRTRDVVVVGASAGGVEALRTFVSALPADLPATVLVVLHMPSGGSSALARIIDRAGPLPAMTARSGVELAHRTILVAPPDHHLLVMDNSVALSHGPTENGHRPAINALFRSAAIAAGPAVTGVQLSGALDDGVAGLVSIGQHGGVVMVQDPADALYPSMPEQALRHANPDHVLPAADMGGVLAKIVREQVDPATVSRPSMPGYSCPDCSGTLAEVDTARYRCRVGHAWTAEALLEAQGSAWERALWAALRTPEKKVSLGRRMADQARKRGADMTAERYQRGADEAEFAAGVLRRYLSGAIPEAPTAASP